MYSVAPRIGPIDNGTYLYAITVQSVAAKKIKYAIITLALRYSLILFLYFFSVLFLRIICETAEIKVPAMYTSTENIIYLSIATHHQSYANQNNGSSK